MAFCISLYRSLRLFILTPEPNTALVYHFSLYIPEHSAEARRSRGFSLDNRNSFFERIILGAEQAASELNSAISVHSLDPGRSELDFAAFTGVDGVIICPYLDDDLSRRQLERIREHQLPAVLINHNLPSAEPWPFIGINNFDLGRRIGVMLSNTHENIRLAVVYSDKAPGIYTERELVEMGISASLGKRLSGPIMSYRTNLNPLDAEALLDGIFRSPGLRPENSGTADTAAINTIVFTDPEDTIAAAQTLVDMNLVGEISVIGFGTDPGVMESLRKGIISATVVINPERIGYEAVYSLTALRTTGYSSASIDTGIEIITGSDYLTGSQ